MNSNKAVTFHKFESKRSLFSNVATRCEEILSESLKRQQQVSFIVPGGSTPWVRVGAGGGGGWQQQRPSQLRLRREGCAGQPRRGGTRSEAAATWHRYCCFAAPRQVGQARHGGMWRPSDGAGLAGTAGGCGLAPSRHMGCCACPV